jgi:DNA modification methylase
MSVITGDCLAAMAAMEPDSIDALVTDPPYDLVSVTKRFGSESSRNTPAMGTDEGGVWARKARGFMGKTWDGTGVAFNPATWAEALRVAKPGAHLLAFGGTRTVHRMVCAIEDAGWEIRDMLVWGYASGFPKSLDVSKAIDKAAGATRDVVGPATRHAGQSYQWAGDVRHPTHSESKSAITAPATEDAAKWDGWGTALKPAWEPIVLARKPMRGTVAANVLEHGTGALNIDGCRIDYGQEPVPDLEHWKQTSGGWKNASTAGVVPNDNSKGRWPANVILTDPIFDGDMEGVEGAGAATTGGSIKTARQGFAQDSYMGGGAGTEGYESYGDSGTYSRFFVIPKAARSEREPAGHTGERANTHPTVKPVGLMRHLVRLVTPRGGVVLDPFLGSGTTAVAAIEEGFDWIGIEKEAEYVSIAEARIAAAQAVKEAGMGLWDL